MNQFRESYTCAKDPETGFIGAPRYLFTSPIELIDWVYGNGHLYLRLLTAIRGVNFCLHHVSFYDTARMLGAYQPARWAPSDIRGARLKAHHRRAWLARVTEDLTHYLGVNDFFADSGAGNIEHYLACCLAHSGRMTQKGELLCAFNQHELCELPGDILERGLWKLF
jgi:hypothetical protein